MKISMLTTTFPKFPTDSHGPWILTMANSLAEMGHKVTVVTPSANDLKQNNIDFKNLRIIRFRYCFKSLEQVAYGSNIPENIKHNPVAKLAFPCFVFGFLWGAIHHLFNSDLIHAQFGYSGVFSAFAKKIRFNKKPLIISFYGRDLAHAFKYPKIYRFAFNQANAILALSEDMKQGLIQAGCDPKKILIHHLGVDLKQFDATFFRRTDTNQKTTLLLVAKFVKKKGIDLAIEALAKLFSDNPNYREKIILKLVGNGPEKSSLEKLINQHRLENQIEFIDNYKTSNPRQTVIQAMKEADIFILPSKPAEKDYGGTPIVLMEASAMKLPVITTNDAGNAEIILHNKTGFVTPVNDINKLANSIKALIDNPDLRLKFGEAGFSHINREFNHTIQMKKLENIYKQTIPVN